MREVDGTQNFEAPYSPTEDGAQQLSEDYPARQELHLGDGTDILVIRGNPAFMGINHLTGLVEATEQAQAAVNQIPLLPTT